jgi:hypothetical protein
LFAASSSGRLDDICHRVEAFFNFNLKLPLPEHIRTDATRDLTRDQLIDMGVSIVLDARLLPGLHARMSMKSRWGSLNTHLQLQGAGCKE